jgi:hypothetical protein
VTDAQMAVLTIEELKSEIWAAERMAITLKDPARKGLLKRLHCLNKALADRLSD